MATDPTDVGLFFFAGTKFSTSNTRALVRACVRARTPARARARARRVVSYLGKWFGFVSQFASVSIKLSPYLFR